MRLFAILFAIAGLGALLVYNMHAFEHIAMPPEGVPATADTALDWAASQARLLVCINLAVVVGLALLVWLTDYAAQRRTLAMYRSVNEQIEQRQAELEHSKKVLYSLMEDLALERNAATSLSNQLQRANDAMAVKNEEMEQFIFTVSHDLKSPLVTIAGFSNQLQDELRDRVTPRQQHRLDRIQSNVSHMEVLLEELLQFSRVIQQDVTITPNDTRRIVTEQLAVLEEAVVRAGARVTLAECMDSVWANERLLSECVHNLLGNALKYAEPNRPLEIVISTRSLENATELSIADNGIGIDPRYHEQVFRIFERLGHGEGTGVGLAIVKAVMDKHGGSVDLDSSLSVGSTFRLRFPKPAHEVPS